MKILQSLTVLSVILLAIAACDEPATAPTSTPEADPLIEQLVAMGAKRDQIVDRGDHFVVEGDIRLDKTALRAARRAAEPDGRAYPAGPRHQRYVSTVATNRKIIHVDLSAVAAENTAWANATRAAMNNWNSVANSYISFVESGPADIVVSFVNTLNTQPGECVVALGAWPSSGAPGATVQISRLYAGAYTNAEQVWIMTHELGHNIGLAHTDQTFGTQLSATPTSDGASVMNSGNAFGSGCPPAAPAWTWFSNHDQVAMQTLYPIPTASGLSVSHPSGMTVVSWDPSGALYYQVQRVEERAVNDWISNDFSTTITEEGWSAPIYGTSFITSSAWTGVSSCWWTYAWAYDDTSTYSYQVVAVFANGTNSNVPAVLSEDAAC
jgi:hypothetical protein